MKLKLENLEQGGSTAPKTFGRLFFDFEIKNLKLQLYCYWTLELITTKLLLIRLGYALWQYQTILEIKNVASSSQRDRRLNQ